MSTLRNLFKDQTWVAHLLGLASITVTEVTSGNVLVSGIIAALTAVFHVAQTFGNGTAVPAGYTTRPSTTLNPGAAFGTPRVDAPAPIFNADGTTRIEL